MDLLVNDLSVHEQFHNPDEFWNALSRFMTLRVVAERFGCRIYCHSALLNTKPIRGRVLRSVIGNLQVDRQRAVMAWLNRSGPFWDHVRRHGAGDWLQCNDEIVTDKAVGEAAFRILHQMKCGLVSFTPSEWSHSPLDVTWVRDAEGLDNRSAEIENWWRAETLEESLKRRVPPLRSWDDLREASRSRFVNLVFADRCFAPLAGVPFAKCSADRLMVLLDVLDRFTRTFGDDGKRDAEGRHIHRDYFTGKRALFSDSSDSERRDFKHELTFPHPEDPASSLFCPWHGKVPHLTLRLHFSWPVESGKPVYVVYAGPKITKR